MGGLRIACHAGPGNVYVTFQVTNRGTVGVQTLSQTRMREGDYPILADLEDAFEKKDVGYFISFPKKAKNLPLLLRVHSVCMLEQIGDESVVPALCRVLKDDPSPLTRHEAAFTLGQLGYRSATSALVDAMFSDPSPIVRHESAVALSSLGEDSLFLNLKRRLMTRTKMYATPH